MSSTSTCETFFCLHFIFNHQYAPKASAQKYILHIPSIQVIINPNSSNIFLHTIL